MSRRTAFLPFALPELGEAEFHEVREVLESGWLTTGPKAHQFEREFAAYVGASFAISVNSCTAAMHLALEATGLQPGDFVATTPYTFAATAEVIRYFDAVPLLVDVEPDTLNIDPVRLRETIADLHRCLEHGGKPRLATVARALRVADAPSRNAPRRRGTLKAIIPVHIAGHACDMPAILAIAAEHGLQVIDDAAHACSASLNGRSVGSPMGSVQSHAATCFSFYATKTLATGEGGMVVTESEAYAERIRMMSLHGISKDAWKRYTAEGSWYYEILAPGYKYNMPDIIAAIGLAQLRKVDRMRERRAEIARRYNDAFADYSEIQTPTLRPHVGHAWHLYMLRLNDEALSIDRRDFIEQLRTRNISTSVHFIPLHIHPYYEATYGYEPEDLAIAHREYQREVSLPIYSKMSDDDVQSVIDGVTDVVRQFRAKPHYACG